MKKLKILYLRTLFRMNLLAGGSVGHTAGVIGALRRKADVLVVSNDELPGVAEPVRYIRPWLRRGLPNGLLELLNNVQFCLSLTKEELAGHVIYQRHAGFAFAGAWLARRNHIPLILEFNSSDVWKTAHWSGKVPVWKRAPRRLYQAVFALPVMRGIERYHFDTARLIVVVSDALKESLTRQGVPADKILVNPNGVDPQKFYPGCGGAAIRAAYRLEGKIVIGFIGTFGQWHGILELARAIVRLYHTWPARRADVRFLLVGDGLLKPELEAILAESGIGEEVILPGLVPQEEAPRYLDACDIFVSPHIRNSDGTEFFGSPTKLFEYMAMGKGIIAADLAQIGKVLTHHRTAWLVEPGDSGALADAMERLAVDRSLRELLGTAARQEAVEKYTWDSHVERILRAVREM